MKSINKFFIFWSKPVGWGTGFFLVICCFIISIFMIPAQYKGNIAFHIDQNYLLTQSRIQAFEDMYNERLNLLEFIEEQRIKNEIY